MVPEDLKAMSVKKAIEDMMVKREKSGKRESVEQLEPAEHQVLKDPKDLKYTLLCCCFAYC
jgi:hypothetical protein